MARACGLSQSTIASYENGERKSSRSFRKIANVLRVELDWLETGKGPMERRDHYPSTSASDAYPLREPGNASGALSPPAAWPFPSVSPMQINALSASDRQELEKWLRLMVEGYLHAYATPSRPKRRNS
ncbi:helix-turn-helix transcriptional regulator [Bordetella tumulicola]